MEKHTTLNFKTLAFREEGDALKVTLLRLFTTDIPKHELESLGRFELKDAHTIVFENEKTDTQKIETKFSFLLTKHFRNLKNRLTNNPATYIHQNSGIPLIGNVAFGIIYRNSSIIEIKPITSCNLNCIYCSISEGLESKKHDFVVEKDYLVEELKKLINFVDEPVEVHIGVQGEPFLYADMEELISNLQQEDKINKISIDTNGTLLNKEMIDRLAKNDKLQINFSLDALDEEKAKQIAGTNKYNINHVKEMISYASEKLNVVVAPVFVKELNEEEMEKIILFIKSLKEKTNETNKTTNETNKINKDNKITNEENETNKVNKQITLGIQNYLKYKTGRKLAAELPWNEFYQMLDKLEQKHNIKLKLDKDFFNVRKTKELQKPFKEGEVINATLKCPDRFTNTTVAAAKERNISVADCPFKTEKQVKVKILRDKHNIFGGRLI